MKEKKNKYHCSPCDLSTLGYTYAYFEMQETEIIGSIKVRQGNSEVQEAGYHSKNVERQFS